MASSGVNTTCIILAAGKGVRMKSARPKVLHEVGGRAMALYSVDRAIELGCNPIIVVLGNGADEVRPILPEGVEVAIQEKQLGTGHATQCGMKPLDKAERVLVLYGDTPLLRAETLNEFVEAFSSSGRKLAMLTADMPRPNRLGRVIRNPAGDVERVVEASDASPEELEISEINAGIYAADYNFLRDALDKLEPKNVQGEYYLTDVVQAASSEGGVIAHKVDDYSEVLGVNDRAELAAAEKQMNRRKLDELMKAGVTVLDPDNTYVHQPAVIGPDTVIYPGAIIEGDTVIGAACVIESGVNIKGSEIADGAEIRAHSVVDSAKVGKRTTVGPSAHLRPESVIGEDCRIGNFVETKKVKIGNGTKANHLTYLGDAEIGNEVNIGCGAITCNYDGADKHLTIIEDEVFVGSDTQFVAPVRVGKGAYIGSGSTITRDVPAGALSVARGKQRDIPGGGERMKNRKRKK